MTLDEVYEEYARQLDRDKLTQDEKRTALLNYVIDTNGQVPEVPGTAMIKNWPDYMDVLYEQLAT